VYVCWSVFCLGCFGTNTIVSGIVILDNLDSKTISGFVTSILFIFSKLYKIYFVINTEKNIFYSAYLIQFVQFNDLDPREMEYIKSNKLEEDIFEPDWVSSKNVVDIYL
jgi:hypothetical protein